jgi:hypothetical protein
MRYPRWIATGLAPVLLACCAALGHAQSSAPQAELKQAPPTPLAEQKAALGDDDTWDPEWDKIVESAVPADLLTSPKIAKDVKAFCPRFSAMSDTDKRTYWAYFFQALAGAEAGLRSTADVRHTEPEVAVKDDVTHHMVRAQGLLQLTYEDAQRYGCDFDWSQDKDLHPHDPAKTILQPGNNLECGVRILHNQLIDKHKPLLTKSSYWSTLRPGWPGNSVFVKQMSNVPPACGTPTGGRKRHLVQASSELTNSNSRTSRSSFTATSSH